MSDIWSSTGLDGVLRRRLSVATDGRGSFAELWRGSWTSGLAVEFVQANLSRSRAGVLRGLHFHLRQHDLWILLGGRARVGLVDLRASLADEQAALSAAHEEMSEGDALLIPPGVAHGFWALEPVSLLYLVSTEFDGSDEHGFAWDDPLAAIEWPAGVPVLSARDAGAPSLSDVVAGLRERANG